MKTVEEGLLFAVLSGDFVLALSLSLLFTEGSRSWSDFISIFTELDHVQVTQFIRLINSSIEAFFEVHSDSLYVLVVW